MKKKNKWSTFALLLVFFVGLSVMLYPTVSRYWNARNQSEAIVDYEKMLQQATPEDYSKEFAAADAYNQSLRKLPFPLTEYEAVAGYEEILDLNGTGMMGYLTIDKIHLELPLYHGTDEKVLSSAVGHLKGTSLPVGGSGTHAVVSAHRGLPSATLFTNLDHLEEGDTFRITVCDRTLTYLVDQIKTVSPTDTADLRPVAGQDYCTLLTCTPYGINSHRLLVRGVRIETVEQNKIYVTSDAQRIDVLIVTTVVALPMLFTLMMIVLFKPVKKDPMGDDLE
ncbi:MAG: class C sortase [Clostridia bacterium]|nr:class C sortase [Clostridia bacterium]